MSNLSPERIEFIEKLSALEYGTECPEHPNEARIEELRAELRPLERQMREDIEEAIRQQDDDGSSYDALSDYASEFAYSNDLVYESGRFWKPSNC